MSDQPKALKLIEQLDEIAMYSSKSATWALDAVNELERLYAVNQELAGALTDATDAMMAFAELNRDTSKALAALKKLEDV